MQVPSLPRFSGFITGFETLRRYADDPSRAAFETFKKSVETELRPTTRVDVGVYGSGNNGAPEDHFTADIYLNGGLGEPSDAVSTQFKDFPAPSQAMMAFFTQALDKAKQMESAPPVIDIQPAGAESAPVTHSCLNGCCKLFFAPFQKLWGAVMAVWNGLLGLIGSVFPVRVQAQ